MSLVVGIAIDLGLLSLRGNPDGELKSWNWAGAVGGVLKNIRRVNVVDLRCSLVNPVELQDAVQDILSKCGVGGEAVVAAVSKKAAEALCFLCWQDE